MKNESASGIYIHVPFCKQACTYCDFFFETSLKFRDVFTEKLIQEIRYQSENAFGKDRIRTIYFGGGTPSQLSLSELNRILSELHTHFDLALDTEITLEVNPDDITETYLKGLKQAGVTRLSVGVQSFNTNLLDFMNRAHTAPEAKQVLQWIELAGFQSWTVDLIYGNPNQSIAELKKDIETLLSFNPPHISAYSLTVEPHTRLGSMVRKGHINPKTDDEVSDHFDVVFQALSDAGIHQYEVSNFSREGHESIHNSAYWRHVNYLGLGPSAHSLRWNDDTQSAMRWRNKPQLKHYVNEPIEHQRVDEEKLDLIQLAEERLLTGLRTIEGVSFHELFTRYAYSLTDNQKNFIAEMRTNGLIKPTVGTIQFTQNGLRIADYLTLQLITKRV